MVPVSNMPTTYSAAITFRGPDAPPVAVSHFPYAQSFAGVQTFAQAIHAWCTADIIECSFTQSVNPQLGGAGGEVSETGMRVIFSLRKPAESGTKQVSFPAPKITIFEHRIDGYAVTQEVGDAFAEAYSTLCGETYMFERGWLVG